MTRNVMFYSRKGGQGKTTHAVGFAHYAEAHMFTNDWKNSTLEIYEDSMPGRITELEPGQEEIDLDETISNVFDFGGFLDNRIVTVAQFVDVCVIPIFYQSNADLAPAAQTIKELEKYNKNIVILINNTEKDYVPDLKEAIEEDFDYPVFVVNRSRFITRLPNEGKTLFDLFNEGGVNKYMLRSLLPQVREFYDYLLNGK